MTDPQADAAECPICAARKQPGTTEIYVISEGADRYFFDVEKAKTIVADGRPPLALADATIRKMMTLNAYEPKHLDHVDPDTFGILAQRFGGLVLLDGIHRAVRCLREGKTFHAAMLNYEESLACLVRQDIANSDPRSIAAKLRTVLGTAPRSDRIEAEIECSSETLDAVRALLTPEENRTFILRAVPPKQRKP